MFNGKPIICITNDSNARERDGRPRQHRCPAAYSAAFTAAGAIPWVTSECCAQELALLCDALCLSGGDDVDPRCFGEDTLNDTVSLDPRRDAFEEGLIPEFLRLGKPVLGICRGMQMLNVLLGGDVYQDLPAQCGLHHMDVEMRHTVCAEPGTLLGRLFGTAFQTNSTHHQAVRRVAAGFRVAARAQDGVIEAIEHETKPLYGVQFHPERLTGELWDDRTPDFAPLFTFFVELAKRSAGSGR